MTLLKGQLKVSAANHVISPNTTPYSLAYSLHWHTEVHGTNQYISQPPVMTAIINKLW